MITRRLWLQSSMATLLWSKLGLTSSACASWQPLPHGPVRRIAFGSCAKQWEPQPIWKVIANVQPDLFLFLGDNIHGDWHGEDPFTPTRESLQADYRRLADKPEFAVFRNEIPCMGTWDNHDYGKHDGGADFEHKEIRFRIAGPFVKLNFGLIEIDWDSKPSPIIDLSTSGADGNTGFNYSISLSELK